MSGQAYTQTAGELALALSSVAVFKNVLLQPPLRALMALVSHKGDETERMRAFAAFAAALLPHGCDFGRFLLDAVVTDENAYVRLRAANACVPAAMEACVAHELAAFTRMSALTPETLGAAVGLSGYLPAFDSTPCDFAAAYESRMANVASLGFGIYARYGMFHIIDGKIAPIDHPDPVTPNKLIGYEAERQQVIDNTRALLEGRPAANVLLCGDAGTGKSTTVKAVANLFRSEGLRLLEMQKKELYLLPEIMGELSENPLKFILFIDDLSFNKNDDCFGELKAILEGSASSKARNVAIYATSNRRHLVKESFSERDGDDVHHRDTMQELISLSGRFGLTVLFSNPDKALYLEIVRGLAAAKGIALTDAALVQGAEAFALRKGGRSARVAEQYTNSLL